MCHSGRRGVVGICHWQFSSTLQFDVKIDCVLLPASSDQVSSTLNNWACQIHCDLLISGSINDQILGNKRQSVAKEPQKPLVEITLVGYDSAFFPIYADYQESLNQGIIGHTQFHEK